jgi:hypothetical protein
VSLAICFGRTQRRFIVIGRSLSVRFPLIGKFNPVAPGGRF